MGLPVKDKKVMQHKKLKIFHWHSVHIKHYTFFIKIKCIERKIIKFLVCEERKSKSEFYKKEKKLGNKKSTAYKM